MGIARPLYRGRTSVAKTTLLDDSPGKVLRSRHFCVFALQLTLWSATANAGINTLTPIGPQGGMIHDVAFHPTDQTIAYAAGERGFYRSLDAGLSWQLIREDIQPRVIAVSSMAPSRVILLAPGPGLFASDDSGETFSLMSDFPEDSQLIRHIEYARNGTLYAIADDQVYQSINAGFLWALRGSIPLEGDVPVNTLDIDPLNPSQLYVTAGAIERYQSADAGATWTPWEAPIGPIADMEIALSNPPRIWFAGGDLRYSDDGGAFYTAVDVSHISFAVEIHPTSTSTIYSGGGRILRRSTNNGSAWSDVPGTARVGAISDIAINPLVPHHILVSGMNGIMGSLDGGNTWTTRNEGLDGVTVSDLIAAPASDRIYARTLYGGVYAISGEDETVAPLGNDELRALYPSTATIFSAGFAVVSGTEDRLFTSLPSGVARSSDSGSSWSLSTDLVAPDVQVMQVANVSTDGAAVLAITNEAVWRSVNGGESFTRSAPVADAESLTSNLAVSASNLSVVYLIGRAPGDSETSALYKSVDAGAQWARVIAPSSSQALRAIAVDPRDENVLYVSNSLNVFKSIDGAQSWSTLGSLSHLHILTGVLALDPRNPDVIYAGAIGQLFRSVDAGETWETTVMDDVSDPYARFVDALAVDPLRSHKVFVGLQTGGVRSISIQPDLSIAASTPATPQAYGTSATSTFSIENLGPFDATGVRIQIELPVAATDVAVSASSGTCTTSANTGTCITPILRVGASAEISVLFTLPTAGEFQITGSVSGDQPDAANSDNTVSSSISVAEVSDVSIQANPMAQVVQGNAIVHAFAVGNSGPNDASNVTATFELNPALGYSSAVASAGSCTISASTATCTIPTVTIGASETITLTTLSANAVGSFTTTSTLTTAGTDLDPADNSAAVSTAVIAASPPSSGGNTGGGGSGGGGGGAMPLWMLLLLACGAGVRTARRQTPQQNT